MAGPEGEGGRGGRQRGGQGPHRVGCSRPWERLSESRRQVSSRIQVLMGFTFLNDDSGCCMEGRPQGPRGGEGVQLGGFCSCPERPGGWREEAHLQGMFKRRASETDGWMDVGIEVTS